MDRIWQMRKLIAISFAIVVLLTVSVLLASAAQAQTERTEGSTGDLMWAFLAASISTGFGCVGAGVAVAYVGAAAVGAVGERPEVAGRTLIFVGLAEGIAIYGLIIAIMILAKV